ncbi:Uncharacterised protein [uncultured archaeon]|nr:Uncharacterised protein [uncultured archaeon]
MAECLRDVERNFENALSMGGKKAIESAYDADWSVGPISLDFHKRLSHRMLSPLLQFGKGETILLPNMVSGYFVAPLAYDSFVQLDRQPAGYAFVGWSRNGRTAFEDGTVMKQKFYVPPSHLKLLSKWADEGKIAVIVDDCEDTGGSKAALCDNLGRIGFEKICCIAYDRKFSLVTANSAHTETFPAVFTESLIITKRPSFSADAVRQR